jgi:hypothetical protein
MLRIKAGRSPACAAPRTAVAARRAAERVHRRTPRVPSAAGAPPSSSPRDAVPAAAFLDALASAGLSPCRFVVVGSGAILESVGAWSPVRYADRPTGTIATVSNEGAAAQWAASGGLGARPWAPQARSAPRTFIPAPHPHPRQVL